MESHSNGGEMPWMGTFQLPVNWTEEDIDNAYEWMETPLSPPKAGTETRERTARESDVG